VRPPQLSISEEMRDKRVGGKGVSRSIAIRELSSFTSSQAVSECGESAQRSLADANFELCFAGANILIGFGSAQPMKLK